MFEVTVAQFINEAVPDGVEYAILVYVDRKKGRIVKFQTRNKYNEGANANSSPRKRTSLEWKPRGLLTAQQRTTAFRGEVSVGFLPRGDEYLDSMEESLWKLESLKATSRWTSLRWIAVGLGRLEGSGLAINARNEDQLLRRLKQLWMDYENNTVMVSRPCSPCKAY